MLLRLTFFILLLIAGNSCCDENRGCCGSKPPDPELVPEAQAWLDPYEAKQYFIFENQVNQLDTLIVSLERDTEYCGGDECGYNCQVERAVLRSRSYSSIVFKIEARENRVIDINEPWRYANSPDKGLLSVRLLTGTKVISPVPDFVDAYLISDYFFKGDRITAIKAQCNDAIGCKEFKLLSMVVAKEDGLVEFMDDKGPIDLDPKDAMTFNNRAYLFQTQKNYRAAVQDYSKAIELNPAYISALVNRGITEMQLNQFAKAEADFEKCIRLDPKAGELRRLLGISKLKLNKNVEACKDFEAALNLGDQDVIALIRQNCEKRKN